MSVKNKTAVVIRQGNRQFLYRVTVNKGISGTRAEAYRLAEELIPEHVMDTLGIFGDTGNWRSKFSKVIDAQIALAAALEEFESD